MFDISIFLITRKIEINNANFNKKKYNYNGFIINYLFI